MKRSILVAALAASALSLAACAAPSVPIDGGGGGASQAIVDRIDDLQTGLMVADIAIAGYAVLRPCGSPGAGELCSSPSVAAQLQGGVAAAKTALATARAIATASGSDAAAKIKALEIARALVTGALQLAQQYRLTG